jgi:hypothetical protein
MRRLYNKYVDALHDYATAVSKADLGEIEATHQRYLKAHEELSEHLGTFSLLPPMSKREHQ